MESPPVRLYKYFAPERAQLFDDWLIRFTQPSALNDPFEMRPHIAGYGTAEEVFAIAANRWETHIKSQYEDLVRQRGKIISYPEYRAGMEKHRLPMIEKALEATPEHNAEIARKIDAMINTGIGVLSLCEQPDSLLMWPHYADSHRGFVVEFDTASPFFKWERPPAHIEASEEDVAKFVEEYGRLRVVRYNSERPSVVVTKMSFDVLLTKGQPWEYEHEWRMLMPLDYADEKRSGTSKYPLFLFKLPPSAVTRIILGCNAKADLTTHVLQLRQKSETQHIAIEKAHVDEKHFRLQFEPVKQA